MARVGRNWNGRIYGTNTGNVALTLDGENDALTGVIRFRDDEFGLAIFNVTGTFSEGKIELIGTSSNDVADGVQVGDVQITGSLTADGRIDGEWRSTIGTGGTFQLYPHSY